MFDHVTMRVSDPGASERFYETVLATIGIAKTHSGEHYAEWNDFSLARATSEAPETNGRIDHLWIRVSDLAAASRFYETIAPFSGYDRRGGDIDLERVMFATDTSSFSIVKGEPTENVNLAFTARHNETVDTFHSLALAAGYRDHGAPGERPIYHPGYYGALLIGHADEEAVRRTYPDHLARSTSILAFHKPIGEGALLLERHGSQAESDVRAAARAHGFEVVLGERAHERLPMRD